MEAPGGRRISKVDEKKKHLEKDGTKEEGINNNLPEEINQRVAAKEAKRTVTRRNTTLVDKAGNYTGTSGSGEDFTERMRSEEDLRTYNESLEELGEERTAKLTEANKHLQREITERVRTEEALLENEDRFRNAFDHAAIGRGIAEPKGNFIRVNKSFCQMIGYTEEELLKKSWMDITHPDNMKKSLEYVKQLIEGKTQSFRYLHRLIHKNGSTIWVDLTMVLIKDANGNPIYTAGDIVDVTERVLAEEALRESEERYREFVEGTDDLVTQVDNEARFTFINHMAEKIYGLPPDECLGLSAFDFVHPDDRDATRKAFASWVENKVPNATFENRLVSRRGEVRDMLWTINFHHGYLGELIEVNSIGRDITERKQSEKILQHLATHDPLTDLPNRTLFFDRLRHAISLAERSNVLVAVMFLDLDEFKSVNDAFGHEKGDLMLQEVTARLKHCVRESDTVARLAGDEFTIAIENIAKPEDAAIIARKILIRLSEPFFVDEQQFKITASIGISLHPQDGKDVESLIKTADSAMYLVKKTTKNDYKFFSI